MNERWLTRIVVSLILGGIATIASAFILYVVWLLAEDNNVQAIEWVILLVPIAVGTLSGAGLAYLGKEPIISVLIGSGLALTANVLAMLIACVLVGSSPFGVFILLPGMVVLNVPAVPAAWCGSLCWQLTRHPTRPGLCPMCDYDLRGHSGRNSGCPECGWNREVTSGHRPGSGES